MSSCVYMPDGGYAGTMGTKLRVFQTLDTNEALVWYSNYESNYNVAKVVTNKEVLYDDLVLYGDFVIVDTYTYYTKNDVRKTVPVLMRRSEYQSNNR